MLQTIRSKLPEHGLKLDPRMTLIGLALIAALLAVGVVFYLWRDQGSFRPLYGSGEAYPAAEVMQVLDGDAIIYRLHPQSGQVLVREDQLGRARMLLAAKGVQVKVPAGYELFDKDEPLGTSQFVQDVRLKRSLEGELARTVMALKGVEGARVHLALQESSSFVVGKRDPGKASVMLQLAPGYKLAPEQVSAIVNLVAGSVPQLDAGNVQVVDQYGAHAQARQALQPLTVSQAIRAAGPLQPDRQLFFMRLFEIIRVEPGQWRGERGEQLFIAAEVGQCRPVNPAHIAKLSFEQGLGRVAGEERRGGAGRRPRLYRGARQQHAVGGQHPALRGDRPRACDPAQAGGGR